MPQVPSLAADALPPCARTEVALRLVFRRYICITVGLLLAACSPALDWRGARPEGWAVTLLMPCRPDQHERQLRLADQPVRLGMLVCEADGHTYALASAALADPSQVGPVLQALVGATRDNLQAQLDQRQPARVKGMTPRPEAGQWQLQGKLPDGRAVTAQALVFAHGMRVYQATVIGPQADAGRVQAFFGAIELQP